MRSFKNLVHPVTRQRKANAVPVRYLKPIEVPFSDTGIVAVLACPVLLATDMLSAGFTFLGIIFVIILALLSNERRTLIALFAAVATITLAIDLRFIYALPESELAVTDKFLAMIALPVLAYALIRQRTTKLKLSKRKPVVNMTVIQPINERIALNGESKSVFRHICRSHGPLDEYTRELIWFVYLKSPKN